MKSTLLSNSAEQILVPDFLVAGQQPMLGMDADRPRGPHQLHAGLLRRAADLPVVPAEAGRYQVLPVRRATATPRDHVVERQLTRLEPAAAVLATCQIAEDDP